MEWHGLKQKTASRTCSSTRFRESTLAHHFKLVYTLRTKIERLIGRMKGRFKMKHLYKRGVANIRGHILKFINLMHILASVTGTYGV